MTKRAIKQKDPFGCSIACVAYILNWTYDKTLSKFENGQQKASSSGFFCRDIIKVLEKNGKEYQYRYMRSKVKKKIYQKETMVFIQRSKKYPAGHYLVRTQNNWMDPWINFQQNYDIRFAKAGFRKKLPGKAIYVVLPIDNKRTK